MSAPWNNPFKAPGSKTYSVPPPARGPRPSLGTKRTAPIRLEGTAKKTQVTPKFDKKKAFNQSVIGFLRRNESHLQKWTEDDVDIFPMMYEQAVFFEHCRSDPALREEDEKILRKAFLGAADDPQARMRRTGSAWLNYFANLNKTPNTLANEDPLKSNLETYIAAIKMSNRRSLLERKQQVRATLTHQRAANSSAELERIDGQQRGRGDGGGDDGDGTDGKRRKEVSESKQGGNEKNDFGAISGGLQKDSAGCSTGGSTGGSAEHAQW